MKGGSVASDAVTGLVSDAAYSSLTKNFSHFMDVAKCGGAAKKCSSSKCGGKKVTKPKAAAKPAKAAAKPAKAAAKAKKPKAKKGGNPFSTVSNAVTRALQNALGTTPSQVSEGFNVFKSSHAPAGYEMADLRGTVNAAKTGGFIGKNLSQYANSNVKQYSVRNRRGGSLDYSAIPQTSDMKGIVNARATPEAVDRLMASNSQSVSPSLDKTTAFGGVKDSAQYFSYSGADKMVSPVVQGGKCKACKKTKAKSSKK